MQIEKMVLFFKLEKRFGTGAPKILETNSTHVGWDHVWYRVEMGRTVTKLKGKMEKSWTLQAGFSNLGLKIPREVNPSHCSFTNGRFRMRRQKLTRTWWRKSWDTARWGTRWNSKFIGRDFLQTTQPGKVLRHFPRCK